MYNTSFYQWAIQGDGEVDERGPEGHVVDARSSGHAREVGVKNKLGTKIRDM